MGRGQVGGGVWEHGGVTTCMHMHTHACKCMYRNCKWLPTWRHPCLSCLTCMCVLVCVHGTPLMHPYLTPPPSTHLPPPGGTPGIGQNSIALELIKIFQFRLKIWNLWRFEICGEFPTHGWVHDLVGGWMGEWVDGWDQVKSLKFNKSWPQSR